jgi:paraquat-inducible protein B
VKLDGVYAEYFSRQGSVYSLVQPHVSLNGVKNLTTAVLGDSLAVSQGEGERHYQFMVDKHNVNQMAGLLIELHAEQLGSVTLGDPLLYKQLKIGEVAEVELTRDSQKVAVKLVVYPEHQSLITQQSKFYNASGIKVDAGLFSGVKIETQTLDSIVAGGIALATDVNAQPAIAGQIFTLHSQPLVDWEDGVITQH